MNLVIKSKHLPLPGPLLPGVVAWLVCDRFGYPHWLCWPLGGLMFLHLLTWIYQAFTNDYASPRFKDEY